MNSDQTVPREQSGFGPYCLLQEDERRETTNILTGGMRVNF